MRLPLISSAKRFTVLGGPFAGLAESKFAGLAKNKTESDEEEGEENEKDEKSKKKTKKSKNVDDVGDDGEDGDDGDDGDEDDDEDEEDEDDPKARAARGREKSRIRAILNSTAGRRLPAVAQRIALSTSMPRAGAIKLLDSMTKDLKAAGGSLRERMASTGQPDIGAGGAEVPNPKDTAGIAAAIIQAGKRRRGEI